MRRYQLALAPDGTAGITCLVCGRTSYHPRDISERYCGACHAFHDMRDSIALNNAAACITRAVEEFRLDLTAQEKMEKVRALLDLLAM